MCNRMENGMINFVEILIFLFVKWFDVCIIFFDCFIKKIGLFYFLFDGSLKENFKYFVV